MERYFMGKKLILSAELEEGAIYMHPQTIFDMTGQRPEGPTIAGNTILIEGTPKWTSGLKAP